MTRELKTQLFVFVFNPIFVISFILIDQLIWFEYQQSKRIVGILCYIFFADYFIAKT